MEFNYFLILLLIILAALLVRASICGIVWFIARQMGGRFYTHNQLNAVCSLVRVTARVLQICCGIRITPRLCVGIEDMLLCYIDFNFTILEREWIEIAADFERQTGIPMREKNAAAERLIKLAQYAGEQFNPLLPTRSSNLLDYTAQ